MVDMNEGAAGKVLHVCKVYLPTQGGVQAVIQRICAGLNPRGWSSAVLTTSERAGVTVLEDKTQVHRARSLGEIFSMPIAPSMLWRLRKLSKKYELVCVHYPFPIADLAALLMGRKAAPLVVYWHSEIVSQKLSSILVRPLTKLLLSRATKIVLSSPPLLAHSKLLKPHKNKCVVIPFGMPKPTAVGEQYLPSNSDYFVMIGRHVPYKGIDVLLRAYAEFATKKSAGAKTKLVVIGSGPLLRQHQALAESLGVLDAIQFVTNASDADVQSWLRGSRCLVLPSVLPSEAFALVQVEAMAHGKPVINTSLASGVPWVARDGKEAITVTPGDVTQLSDAIHRFALDDTLADRCGEAARERVNTVFNYTSFCDATASLYRSVGEVRRDNG
jgi:glycosyltransferase involved in cell wall biosynthesis